MTPDLIRPLMVVGGLSRRGTGPGTYAGDGRREGGSYFSRDPWSLSGKKREVGISIDACSTLSQFVKETRGLRFVLTIGIHVA